MKADSFRYEFTPQEFKYFMFGKKVCPKCGGKLIKSKCSEIIDGSVYNSPRTPLYIQGSTALKRYYYLFSCAKCGSQYKLSELAK